MVAVVAAHPADVVDSADAAALAVVVAVVALVDSRGAVDAVVLVDSPGAAAVVSAVVVVVAGSAVAADGEDTRRVCFVAHFLGFRGCIRSPERFRSKDGAGREKRTNCARKHTDTMISFRAALMGRILGVLFRFIKLSFTWPDVKGDG